jgi:predicted nucleic acid-binding protein
MKLLDTTFLIDMLRGKKETLKIANSSDILLTTQLNLYEVARGLFLRNLSQSKFIGAMSLFENIRVLPLDDNGLLKSAEISADLIKKGIEICDCDCLTAGIALSKGVSTIVTNNSKHFARIKGIAVEEY